MFISQLNFFKLAPQLIEIKENVIFSSQKTNSLKKTYCECKFIILKITLR